MQSGLRFWMVVLIAVAVGTGTGWIYTHPPLRSTGLSERYTGDKTLAYGIDLQNTGRWSLRLTGVRVNGENWEYPRAMAVANFTDTHLAGNAAIDLDANGHKLKTRPVRGWEIEPRQRVLEKGEGSYGLRLDWEGMPSEQTEVIIYYRYLGLPLRHAVTSIWAIP